MMMVTVILRMILIMGDLFTLMAVFNLVMPVLILTLRLIGLPLLAADFWLMSAIVLILVQLLRLSLPSCQDYPGLGCDLFNPKISSGLCLSHTCPHRC